MHAINTQYSRLCNPFSEWLDFDATREKNRWDEDCRKISCSCSFLIPPGPATKICPWQAAVPWGFLLRVVYLALHSPYKQLICLWKEKKKTNYTSCIFIRHKSPPLAYMVRSCVFWDGMKLSRLASNEQQILFWRLVHSGLTIKPVYFENQRRS